MDEHGAIVDQIRAKPVMVVRMCAALRNTRARFLRGTKHYLQDAQMRMVRGAAATPVHMVGDVDNSSTFRAARLGSIGTIVVQQLRGNGTSYRRLSKTGDFESLVI